VTLYQEPNFPAIFTENFNKLRDFDRDMIQALGTWSQVLKSILDGGISLNDNMDAAVVSYTSNAVADTEDTVAHTLGKIPTYFVVGDIDKGGVVYRSGTTFTRTQIFVKCSAAGAAVKLILL
jgi:hypothetical protein